MSLVGELRAQQVLAIVRGRDASASVKTLIALAEEGIPLLEVSLTSQAPWGVIDEALRELAGVATLGVGTVLSADDAQRAHDCGAAFAVTPAVSAGAVTAVTLGLPVLVGALTPTEIASAVEIGASAIKLFPASVGGPDYLRAVRAPFPDIDIVPVGGVSIDDVATYLASGALAVGVGSPLVGDAADGGELSGLRQRARLLRRALNAGPQT
jgi:2-dehydro-3-deoxyphosphogluconate aldolase/(4S)-4-hydroxy-2-oxoglutarate aldolase